MIKYAIFDMDGLMIDTERLSQESFYKHVGPSIGVDFEPGELLGFIGRNRKALNEWWAENIQTKYGIEYTWNDVSVMSYQWQMEYFMEHGVPVKEGLINLLNWLKDKGIPCAVATSTDSDRTRQKLKGAGLLGYFEAMICGNMVSKSKPDPEIFIKAAEALGCNDPSEAVVFEDSILGTRAGVAGGFNVIAVPDLVPLVGPHIDKCLAKVGQLDEAIAILKPLVE